MFPRLQAFGGIISLSRGGMGKCTLGDDIGRECDWTLDRFSDMAM
jgi:hypothetical protein